MELTDRPGDPGISPQRETADREAGHRYHAIFNAAPVSIWEEDFSEVRADLERLRRSGVSDLGAYLRRHPEFVHQAIRQVRILDANEASLAMFEASSKDELLTSLSRTFLPESAPVCADELVAFAEGRLLFSSERAVRTLRGGTLDVMFTVRFMPGARAVVSLTDITARKRMEQYLRESESRFRNMADHAPMMVWITEPDAVCTYLSKSWYEFTGQTPEAGLGFGWVDAVHPDDRRYAHDTFAAANARREPFRLDYRLRRRDGVYRWAIDAAAPRFGQSGDFLGYVGSVNDVTERKEAETMQQMLVAELNHRVKNTLATVHALAQQTARHTGDLQQFVPAFQGRLQALSQAHRFLTERGWRGADLRELIRDQVLLDAVDETRIQVWGPSVLLTPQVTVHLALVLHELSTNARKHGALSSMTGWITVNWTLNGNILRLQWIERGGPPLASAPVTGFGAQLIERTLRSHQGEARMQRDPRGVSWTMTLVLPAPTQLVSDQPEIANVAVPRPPAQSTRIAGKDPDHRG